MVEWKPTDGTMALDTLLRQVQRRRMAALNAMHDAVDEDEILAAGELLQASLDDIPGLVRLVEGAY